MTLTDDKNAEEAIERLMRDIRNEPVPQKIVQLALQLQTALDARGHASRKEEKTGNAEK